MNASLTKTSRGKLIACRQLGQEKLCLAAIVKSALLRPSSGMVMKNFVKGFEKPSYGSSFQTLTWKVEASVTTLTCVHPPQRLSERVCIADSLTGHAPLSEVHQLHPPIRRGDQRIHEGFRMGQRSGSCRMLDPLPAENSTLPSQWLLRLQWRA